MIPVYARRNGRREMIGRCSQDEAALMPKSALRKRKGKIRAVYLEPHELSLINLSRTGYHKRQELNCGWVHALVGVTGSEGSDANWVNGSDDPFSQNYKDY